MHNVRPGTNCSCSANIRVNCSLTRFFSVFLDSQGGLGKMVQLFGTDMNTLIDELNEELVA